MGGQDKPFMGGQDAHPTRKFTLCGTGGQDAHPTRKFTLCGTGILPVLNGISGPPHKKIYSLWNGHLARS